MIKTLMYFLCVIAFLFIVFIVIYSDYLKYKQVEKHFPGMTYQEYLLLDDKIRITPK